MLAVLPSPLAVQVMFQPMRAKQHFPARPALGELQAVVVGDAWA